MMGDRIRIIKVDVDKYGVTASQPMEQREQKPNLFGLCRVATEEDDSQYGIQSVPTLMLYSFPFSEFRKEGFQNISLVGIC